jgi:hypothetical protein
MKTRKLLSMLLTLAMVAGMLVGLPIMSSAAPVPDCNGGGVIFDLEEHIKNIAADTIIARSVQAGGLIDTDSLLKTSHPTTAGATDATTVTVREEGGRKFLEVERAANVSRGVVLMTPLLQGDVMTATGRTTGADDPTRMRFQHQGPGSTQTYDVSSSTVANVYNLLLTMPAMTGTTGSEGMRLIHRDATVLTYFVDTWIVTRPACGLTGCDTCDVVVDCGGPVAGYDTIYNLQTDASAGLIAAAGSPNSGHFIAVTGTADLDGLTDTPRTISSVTGNNTNGINMHLANFNTIPGFKAGPGWTHTIVVGGTTSVPGSEVWIRRTAPGSASLATATITGNDFTIPLTLTSALYADLAAGSNQRLGIISRSSTGADLVVSSIIITQTFDGCGLDGCDTCDAAPKGCPLHGLGPVWELDTSKCVPGGITNPTGTLPTTGSRAGVGNTSPEYRPGIQTAGGTNITTDYNNIHVSGDSLIIESATNGRLFYILGGNNGSVRDAAGFWSEADGFAPEVGKHYAIGFDYVKDGPMGVRFAPNNEGGINSHSIPAYTIAIPGTSSSGSVKYVWTQTVAPTGGAGNALGAFRIGFSGTSARTDLSITNLRIYESLRADATVDDCICAFPLIWGKPTGDALHLAATTDSKGDKVSWGLGGGISGNHNPSVLEFADIGIPAGSFIGQGELTVGLTGAAAIGNRSVHIWTDLSPFVSGAVGGSDAGADSFVVQGNVAAGAIFSQSVSGAVVGGRPGFTFNIPANLLYIEDDGMGNPRYATKIYMLGTITGGANNIGIRSAVTASNDYFRIDVTNRINHVTLRLIEPPEFARNISLNPGAVQGEIGFTWWTLVEDDAPAAILQVAKVSDLTAEGEMPAPGPELLVFNGTINQQDADFKAMTTPPTLPQGITQFEGAYGFDVNRAMAIDLELGEAYAYRVGDGARWSSIHNFNTFDPKNEAHSVIIVGDPQVTGNATLRNYWQDTMERAVNRADSEYGGASFMISTGDQVSPANRLSAFNDYLSPPELRSLPVMVNIGNHDTHTQDNPGEGVENPLSMTSMIYNWPNHDWLGGNPRHTSNYYRGGGNWWFIYGDVLYVSMNGNSTNYAAHDKFLEDAIVDALTENPDIRWRVVTFHQDPFGGGTGHSANMAARQRDWAPILMKHDIDIVFNGHDHTYTRSHFMGGNAAGRIGQDVMIHQHPDIFDANQNAFIGPKPQGAYVDPNGILYITTGSASDFPKYTSVVPWHAWVAYSDPAQHDNYAQYAIMTIDGDSLTVDVWVVPYTVAAGRPTTPDGTRPEFIQDSFTIRKTANFENLENLIDSIEDVAQNNISQVTWEAFQAALDDARLLTASDSASDIHEAYMLIYETYYALDPQTNKDALTSLITEVRGILATTSEGLWAGQFEAGSQAVLRAVLNEAVTVNELLLAVQADIDAEHEKLTIALGEYMTKVSTVPAPWLGVHEIPNNVVHTIGLLDWMSVTEEICTVTADGHVCVTAPTSCNLIETEKVINRGWVRAEGNAIHDLYSTHFTKVNFAGGRFTAGYVFDRYSDEPELSGSANPYFNPQAMQAIRTDLLYAPSNAPGGRFNYGDAATSHYSHITQTHAGEWIRYELDVAEAGMYEIKLGALNPLATAQQVLLRDDNYNTLTTFRIPGSYGYSGTTPNWGSTEPIAADELVYLPAGKYVIEIVFVNPHTGNPPAGAVRHVGSGVVAEYANGPNVDIMTFERISDGTAPVFDYPGQFLLPLPGNNLADVPRRQQGWRTNPSHGNPAVPGLDHSRFADSEYLVLEVASGRPTNNIDVSLISPADGWAQQTFRTDGTGEFPLIWDAEKRTVSIRISDHPAYDAWLLSVKGGTGAQNSGIVVNYNSDSWSELNVIRAWLYTPVPEPVDSRTPAVVNAVAAKEAATSDSVSYTLTSAELVGDVWKVYANSTIEATHATVTAAVAADGLTLTLTCSTGNILHGTYYITVTEDGKEESTRLQLTVAEYGVKTVSVGTQVGQMSAGQASSVTFSVSTAGIAADEYTVSVATLPAGVAIGNDEKVTIDANGAGILTLVGNASTIASVTDDLKLTLGGEESDEFTLTIVQKTVTVGTQSTKIYAGYADTITFPVTTQFITAGSYAATLSNAPAGISVAEVATVPVQVTINASGAGTLTIAASDATVIGVTNTLTLTIDGITSAAFTLTVTNPIDFDAITVELRARRISTGGDGNPQIIQSDNTVVLDRNGDFSLSLVHTHANPRLPNLAIADTRFALGSNEVTGPGGTEENVPSVYRSATIIITSIEINGETYNVDSDGIILGDPECGDNPNKMFVQLWNAWHAPHQRILNFEDYTDMMWGSVGRHMLAPGGGLLEITVNFTISGLPEAIAPPLCPEHDATPECGCANCYPNTTDNKCNKCGCADCFPTDGKCNQSTCETCFPPKTCSDCDDCGCVECFPTDGKCGKDECASCTPRCPVCNEKIADCECETVFVVVGSGFPTGTTADDFDVIVNLGANPEGLNASDIELHIAMVELDDDEFTNGNVSTNANTFLASLLNFFRARNAT